MLPIKQNITGSAPGSREIDLGFLPKAVLVLSKIFQTEKRQFAPIVLALSGVSAGDAEVAAGFLTKGEI